MRLHVVDGTFELFRAYYSKRPDHVTPDGVDAKGVVGVVSSLLTLMEDREEAVTHIGVAFDNPVDSFRNEIYDGYKTGEGMDPVLLAQFDPVEEAVDALGMVVWKMTQWEADDGLATAAAKWRDEVEQVRILTPDKDLGQCIRGTRVVQVDRMRNDVIDERRHHEKKGIAPSSIPDYLALVGDSADGIPGVPRFGAKSAAKLLDVYGHLEDIPKSAADWSVKIRGAEALAGILAEHWEEALLWRRLATLVEDCPLEESLADLEWKGPPRAKWEAWCDRVGASERLRRRPQRWS